jgi:hypothetical protein
MFLLSRLTKMNGVRTAALMPNYQAGVDAFFRSAVAAYTTPPDIPTGAASTTLFVAPTFMMNPGYRDQQAFKADPNQQAAILQTATGAGLSGPALARLLVGRGTPDEIRTIVQALVSSQPASMTLTNPLSTAWEPLDVRQIMHSHAIGLDCAGYVQQAYLRATLRTRAQLGWAEVENEGLFNLSGNGFVRVGKVRDLRPADIIVFNAANAGQPGHRTIVFDQRAATGSDQSALASATNAQTFSAAGDLRVIEMDSSYGSYGSPRRGGVQRQMWFFNGTKWAHLMRLDQEVSPRLSSSTLPFLDVQDGLYGPDDKVEGFYRFQAD